MDSRFLVSQQEVADNFGVNRTTIRAWTKLGLPCIEGDKGKPHMYHLGITLWWRMGRRAADVSNMQGLSALQLIALARLTSDCSDDDGKSPGVDDFSSYMGQAGISENESREAFTFVSGMLFGHSAALKTVRDSHRISSDQTG